MFFAVLMLLSPTGSTAEDPRLAISEVRACVELAKEYLRSSEWDNEEKNQAVISACRHAEVDCVKAVGEGLDTLERSKAEKFLPVIKACRGKGIGDCYRAMTGSMASYNYRESNQAQALLKKCE